MLEHSLRVLFCPAIWQHIFDLGIVGMQSHQQFSDIGPRLDPMAFCARQDGVENRSAGSRVFTAQEQPVFAPDCLWAERSFRSVVVDGQATVGYPVV